MKKLRTKFLEGTDDFLRKLNRKSVLKILYVIDLAEQTNNPKIFKKLQGEIWEFRSQFMGNQYRLLAFWDKRGEEET